jgi:hypothetical protein
MNAPTVEYALRLFMVDPNGVVTEGRLSHAVNAGVDILDDDGMSIEKTLPLLVAAEADGRDPEAFARHLLKLRRALREMA